VPGIDAVYVGPADLSITLGLAPRMDNDGAFLEARAQIAAACDRHGVIAGIHANAQLAAGHAAAGYRMITIASDVGGMGRAARDDLAVVRTAARTSARLYT
jgi:4-hydroxy-2-oxoheptanedioate aldolase